MNFRSLTPRRPSPAILISSAALFMSLGGVGYAATSLPKSSVGTSQLKNNAVTYQKIAPSSVGQVRLTDGGVINSKIGNNAVSFKKIAPGSVGLKRADLNQLQARVSKSCGAGSAIGALSQTGVPTCNATAPSEYGAADATTALSGTAATVTSKSLPAGADYLAFADTQLNATSGPAAQRITVSCTLTVGTATQTRSIQIATSGNSGQVTNAALPLQVAGTSGTGSEGCTAAIPAGAVATSVKATAGLNAIQTASNN